MYISFEDDANIPLPVSCWGWHGEYIPKCNCSRCIALSLLSLSIGRRPSWYRSGPPMQRGKESPTLRLQLCHHSLPASGAPAIHTNPISKTFPQSHLFSMILQELLIQHCRYYYLCCCLQSVGVCNEINSKKITINPVDSSSSIDVIKVRRSKAPLTLKLQLRA